MEQWELGYLAGMIDAECHVGIQRLMTANRKTPAYTIRFELAMTDPKPVQFINSLLPTAKLMHCHAQGRRLPYFRLRVIQQEAITLLRGVYPYVQGKKRQIEICFAIDELRRKFSPSRKHNGLLTFQPMPAEFEQLAYPLYLEFRSLQLNKKPRK